MLLDSPVSIPTQTERNWAMLAHLTALLTVAVGSVTSGVGAVAALLVPLAIYLYFATRSRYVAFHALQATVFQAVAAIAYVVLGAVVGGAIAVAWVVAGVLTVVLVGLLLMPLALALTLFGGGALAVLPLLALGYALYGAYQAYEGLDFRYWLVGNAVLHSLGPVPASAPAGSPAP